MKCIEGRRGEAKCDMSGRFLLRWYDDVALVSYIDSRNEQEFSLVHFTDITSKVASLSPPYKLDMILEMFDEITKLFRRIKVIRNMQTVWVLQCHSPHPM